jgi:hypothetical protein
MSGGLRREFPPCLELNLKDWLLASVCGSASAKSGAEGAEERLAERSRSATPAAEPQTEARRACGLQQCKLVTSARFEKRSGRRREGEGRRAARAAKQTARWSRRGSVGLK